MQSYRPAPLQRCSWRPVALTQMIQLLCCYRTEDNSLGIRDHCRNTPTRAFAIKGCIRRHTPTSKGFGAFVTIKVRPRASLGAHRRRSDHAARPRKGVLDLAGGASDAGLQICRRASLTAWWSSSTRRASPAQAGGRIDGASLPIGLISTLRSAGGDGRRPFSSQLFRRRPVAVHFV